MNAKTIVISVVLFASAVPALAGPKKPWYQRGPLGAAERSIGCMAEPWKDWKCAGIHYTILGAELADFMGSQYALRNCASCRELNPLYGSGRPSPARMYSQGIGVSLLTEHALAQALYEKRPAYGYVTTGIVAAPHTAMAIRGYRITTDDTIRSWFGCPTCTVIR